MSGQPPGAKVPSFIGPDGKCITLADLPPRGLKRYLPRHKTLVVAAVQHGLLTLGDACERYDLSIGDYLAWYRSSTGAPLA